MRRSSQATIILWRCLTAVLGAIFFFLVLLFPFFSILSDPSVSVSQSLTNLNSPARLLMPVVIKDQPTPTLSIALPLITEVLSNPFGYEPEGEWIELFNAGGVSLDLYGYKIGDQAEPGCCEGMLAFPAGAVLRPGQVMVVANKAVVFRSIYGFNPDYEMESSDPAVPVLTRYTQWAERGVELTNTGDEFLLLDGSNQIVDVLSWGTSTFAFDPPISNVPEGYSMERYPANLDTNSALDWRKQSLPHPGVVDLTPPTPTPAPSPGPTLPSPIVPTLIPTPFGGRLFLSEFIADPDGDEPDNEWIEIYNAGNDELQLQDFKIGDEGQAGGEEGMLRFPQGAVLPPGQAIVIANKASDFYIRYGFFPDYEIADTRYEVPDLQAYITWGTSSLNLSNLGDELLLMDGRDELIDAISYGDSIIYLNPSIPVAPEGNSLERYPADQDGNSATDWRVQSEPNPGSAALPTPEPPPIPTPIPILVINEIHISPDPATGDANGDAVIGSKDDQFVEIVNMTGSVVDIGGWSLKDALLTRHIFPAPTLIQNGCSIVIFGGGSPIGDFGGSLVQVATSDALGLSYPMDTLKLFDGAGILVLEFSYNVEGVLGQSVTRNPDITGSEFVPHTSIPAAAGALFSPGTLLDGSPFPGCYLEVIQR
jgi:hypothetical protein